MVKYRTTRKHILDNFKPIIKIGYCNAYHLLKYEKATAFTAGVYGWNSDIYHIQTDNDLVTICTGYRAFGDIKPSYMHIKKFDDEAREIQDQIYDNRETKEKLTRELLISFIREVTT